MKDIIVYLSEAELLSIDEATKMQLRYALDKTTDRYKLAQSLAIKVNQALNALWLSIDTAEKIEQ